MSNQDVPGELTYQLASRQAFLVVSFSGPLSRAAVPTIENCESEIMASGAKFIVLNMQAADGLERPLIASLVRLQKSIRDSSMSFRFCNLNIELFKSLLEAGALRNAEVSENLKEALTSLLREQPQQATAA